MPFASLPPARLVLATDARVFDRHVTVGVQRAADRDHRDAWLDVLADARWVHADRDRATPALSLTIPTTAAVGLTVVVDEGDNSPLPVGQARLLLPSYRLRFYRAAGARLQLAYGREDLAPPRYDLALLAPQLLGVAAAETSLTAAAAPGAAASSPLTAPWLFYSVLGAAVIVLLGLVGKLVGKR